jgi:hypothetical protein
LVVTPDGGFAIVGVTTWYPTGRIGSWLVKTDSNGVMEWNLAYGGYGGVNEAYNSEASSLAVASDGGYVMGGSVDDDFLLVKISSNGTMEWDRTFGGSGSASACSVVATSDGGYAVAGSINLIGFNRADFWLVKTDALGFSPTFSSWLIPLLLITAASLALAAILLILVKRKELLHKRSLEEEEV